MTVRLNRGRPQSAPPQQQQAAGGYRRLATEHTGIVDYTSSRVLQPPGGGGSFTLTDGSDEPPPARNQLGGGARAGSSSYGRAPMGETRGAAGGMASAPVGWQEVSAEFNHHQRRDPNASSMNGGIFGSGAWADEARH